MFGYILEVALPVDYYTSMMSLMAAQKVFSEILSIYVYELDEKFKDLGLESSIFTLQWFVCIFSCNVEQEVSKEFSLKFYYLNILSNKQARFLISFGICFCLKATLFSTKLALLSFCSSKTI